MLLPPPLKDMKSWVSVGALEVALFVKITINQGLDSKTQKLKKQKHKTFIDECGFWMNPMFLFLKKKKKSFLRNEIKNGKKVMFFSLPSFGLLVLKSLRTSLIVAFKFQILLFSTCRLLLAVLSLQFFDCVCRLRI